jgi:polyisoprenoid-binding protein YceI
VRLSQHRLVLTALLVALTVATPPPSSAQTKTIDIRRSIITIHVGKAGLFSAAGHDHWVSAPIASGEINDAGARSVNFAVDAHRLKVKPDTKVNQKDEAEIQQTMQQQVLETEKYPLIQFRSSSIAQAGSGSWSITGKLTLHGVSKPIVVTVKQAGDAYSGNARIKQTHFGIQPVRVAGGAVKVKDEVEVQFDIYALPK